MNVLVKKPHKFIKKQNSTPSPIVLWRGKDNEVLNHIQDAFMDIVKSIQIHQEKPWVIGDSYMSISMKNFVFGSDGAPRNKYTGKWVLFFIIT